MAQSVPVIDLKPLLDRSSENGDGRRAVLEQVSRACEEWGFFQIVNHGVDVDMLSRVLQCSQQFFGLPHEEKLKLATPLYPIGFVHQSRSNGVVDRKEHLLFFGPGNPNAVRNAWPDNPPTFRNTLEEMMAEGARISKFLTSIVLESLGLPDDRAQNLYSEHSDTCILPYYPASPADYESDVVLTQHRDGGIITVLCQLNEIPGLQILKDDQWITVRTLKDSLVVNVGDVLQVWSNGKFKSVMHRVAKQDLDRYSVAYFHAPGAQTRIAPLPEFTATEAPKYRAFLQSEYMELRFKNRNPNNKNSAVSIEHYSL